MGGKRIWSAIRWGLFGTWPRALAVAYFAVLLAAANIHVNGVTVLHRLLPTSHNTLPAGELGAMTGVDLTVPLAAQRPTIIFDRIENYASGGQMYRRAYFIFVNPLNVTVTYTGYMVGSYQSRPPVGEIGPLYGRQEITAANPLWQPSSMGWCGTGAGTMSIPPKHAGRFDVSLEPTVLQARVGLQCSWQNAQGNVGQVEIWSEPTR